MSFSPNNIDALNQLLFSVDERNQLLALGWIEQSEEMVIRLQYSLCVCAYLSHEYRENIEGKAHQLLNKRLSAVALRSLQDSIIILDYARYKFKVPEGWCTFQNPLRAYLNHHEKARIYLEPIFEYIPATISNFYTLLAGRIQQEWEHYKKALYYYEKAVELMPSNTQAQFGVALIIHVYYIKKGLHLDRIEQVLEYYMDAYKSPKNINCYRNAAMLCKDTHDYERSAYYFEAGLKASPNDTSLLNNYATLQFEKFNDFESAQLLAQKGLEISPLDCALLDTLAQIEMQGFKAYAKAEKLFRKALSIDSEHHYSNTGLGDMYTHLGQYEKAVFYYRKGLHNGLQYCSREVVEVIEKLEKLVYLYLHKYKNKNKAKLYQLKLHRLQNCIKK